MPVSPASHSPGDLPPTQSNKMIIKLDHKPWPYQSSRSDVYGVDTVDIDGEEGDIYRVRKSVGVPYLLFAVPWCYEQICLAEDARVHAPSNGVLSPSLVEVVDDVGVSMPNPALIFSGDHIYDSISYLCIYLSIYI